MLVDLSAGARRTVDVDAEALRSRLRRDLAEDLIPAGAGIVRAELRYRAERSQAHVRLAGHTAAAVARPYYLPEV